MAIFANLARLAIYANPLKYAFFAALKVLHSIYYQIKSLHIYSSAHTDK